MLRRCRSCKEELPAARYFKCFTCQEKLEAEMQFPDLIYITDFEESENEYSRPIKDVDRTGDKKCAHCLKMVPKTNFPVKRQLFGCGLDSYCKECSSIRQKRARLERKLRLANVG